MKLKLEHIRTSWKRYPLGELVEFLDSQRKPIKSSERKAGPYPYYGANGQVDSVESYLFDEKLVLVAEDGGFFYDPSRPIAYLVDGKYWVNNHVHVLRTSKQILPEFINYQLGFADVTLYLSGSTRPKLTKSDASRIPIICPPLKEQERIIDILSRAEGIVRLRQEAQKKAEEIIPALFIDMFGDPTENPKGWPVVSLGHHAKISSVVKTPDIKTEAEQLCIGPDSIARYTGQIISRPRVYDVKPKSGKYKFVPGEVIYSKIRPYLAKAILADQEGYCSADMYPLQCKQTLAPVFLLSLLLSRAFSVFASASSVRAQMPKLNRKTLFAYRFPLPPINLQEEFAQQVEIIRSIQSQQATALQKAEAAFDALLARVFN